MTGSLGRYETSTAITSLMGRGSPTPGLRLQSWSPLRMAGPHGIFLLSTLSLSILGRPTQGHPVGWGFPTIPEWMFKTERPVAYSADPNQQVWDYEQGTELRDPSMKEVADYYARVVSWYTRGGFADELGKWHESGHHFKCDHDYWGVFNEPIGEHHISPEVYTALYDAVVMACMKVAPQMKYAGLSLGGSLGASVVRILPES